MIRFLFRLILRTWIAQPIERRIQWLAEDTDTLTLFLSTGCGNKFVLKLREAAADASFRSVYSQPEAAVSATGYARGFCDCLGLVLRLAQRLPSEASEYEPADSQRLPGQLVNQKEQDWRGVVGGGGMIAP